jgi:hypothetical protein
VDDFVVKTVDVRRSSRGSRERLTRENAAGSPRQRGLWRKGISAIFRNMSIPTSSDPAHRDETALVTLTAGKSVGKI